MARHDNEDEASGINPEAFEGEMTIEFGGGAAPAPQPKPIPMPESLAPKTNKKRKKKSKQSAPEPVESESDIMPAEGDESMIVFGKPGQAREGKKLFKEKFVEEVESSSGTGSDTGRRKASRPSSDTGRKKPASSSDSGSSSGSGSSRTPKGSQPRDTGSAIRRRDAAKKKRKSTTQRTSQKRAKSMPKSAAERRGSTRRKKREPAFVLKKTNKESIDDAGRYIEIKELGEGGMGRVLIAYDRKTRRNVALKEIKKSKQGQSESREARFRREALLTSRLQHPGIVPLFDTGKGKAGSEFYTMRLVGGADMTGRLEHIDRHEMTPDARYWGRIKLLDHFIDLCQAVAYMHQEGVIHRDLKPDNVLLGEFGETVLIDLGLARFTDEEDDELDAQAAQEAGGMGYAGGQLSMEGAVMGTPHYMAPEQARGESHKVDARTDVFALGAILYRIACGAPPYSGMQGYEIVAQAASHEITPIKKLYRDVPPELQAIIMRALAEKRIDRYQSAKELADELSAWRDGDRVSVYSYSKFELLRRFLRKHYAATILTFIFLGILAAGGAFGLQQVLEAKNDAERDARLAEAATEEAIKAKEAQEEESRGIREREAAVAKELEDAKKARELAESAKKASDDRIIAMVAASQGHNDAMNALQGELDEAKRSVARTQMLGFSKGRMLDSYPRDAAYFLPVAAVDASDTRPFDERISGMVVRGLHKRVAAGNGLLKRSISELQSAEGEFSLLGDLGVIRYMEDGYAMPLFKEEGKLSLRSKALRTQLPIAADPSGAFVLVANKSNGIDRISADGTKQANYIQIDSKTTISDMQVRSSGGFSHLAIGFERDPNDQSGRVLTYSLAAAKPTQIHDTIVYGGGVQQVAISPDGLSFSAFYGDGKELGGLVSWRVIAGKAERVESKSAPDIRQSRAMAYDSTGQALAVGGEEGELFMVITVTDSDQELRYEKKSYKVKGSVRTITPTNNDGSWLVGTSEGFAYFLEVNRGSSEVAPSIRQVSEVDTFGIPIVHFLYEADKRKVTCYLGDGTQRIFQINESTATTTTTIGVQAIHAPSSNMLYLNDGRNLASQDHPNFTIDLNPSGDVLASRFNSEGEQVLVATRDNRLIFANLDTGQEAIEARYTGRHLQTLAFSEDELGGIHHVLVASDARKLERFEIKDGKIQPRSPISPNLRADIRSLAVHDGGAYLIGLSNGKVILRNLANKSEDQSILSIGAINSVIFNKDGTRAIVAGETGVAMLQVDGDRLSSELLVQTHYAKSRAKKYLQVKGGGYRGKPYFVFLDDLGGISIWDGITKKHPALVFDAAAHKITEAPLDMSVDFVNQRISIVYPNQTIETHIDFAAASLYWECAAISELPQGKHIWQSLALHAFGYTSEDGELIGPEQWEQDPALKAAYELKEIPDQKVRFQNALREYLASFEER